MASWIAALKLVPWGEVIKATPQVVKAAQGMLKKKEAQAEAREQGTWGSIPQSGEGWAAVAIAQHGGVVLEPPGEPADRGSRG